MRAERVGIAALWIVSVAVAGWAGSCVAGSSVRVVARSVQRTAAIPSEPGATVAPGSLGAGEVRTIVRDELARQLAEVRRAPVESGGVEPRPAAEPLAPELQARAEEASRVVERAIGARSWTGDDRKRFASAIRALPAEAIVELQRPLNIAINRGQITIADGLPPYESMLQALQ